MHSFALHGVFNMFSKWLKENALYRLYTQISVNITVSRIHCYLTHVAFSEEEFLFLL
jgi:hypothetical protein